MFKRLLASLFLSAALITPAYAQVDIEFGIGGPGLPGPGGPFPPGPFPPGPFPPGGGPFPPGGGPFPGGLGFPFPGGGSFGQPTRNPGTPYDGQLPPTATTSVDFDITECSWCGQGGSMISNQDFNQLNIDLSNQTSNLKTGGNFPGGPGGAPPGFVPNGAPGPFPH